MEEEQVKSNVIKVVVVVLSYWTISILMVFFNKYLLGGRTDADISLFVTWMQCIITVVLAFFINIFTKSFSIKIKKLREINMWPVFKMAVFFVGMLSFNNMCLKIVGISFYQVLMRIVCYYILLSQ